MSACEIKFWWRSREASGEAARRMGIYRSSPLASGGSVVQSLNSAAKTLFRTRRQNFISLAPTIPPATQGKVSRTSGPMLVNYKRSRVSSSVQSADLARDQSPLAVTFVTFRITCRLDSLRMRLKL